MSAPVSVVRIVEDSDAVFNAVSKAMKLADWKQYINGKKLFIKINGVSHLNVEIRMAVLLFSILAAVVLVEVPADVTHDGAALSTGRLTIIGSQPDDIHAIGSWRSIATKNVLVDTHVGPSPDPFVLGPTHVDRVGNEEVATASIEKLPGPEGLD